MATLVSTNDFVSLVSALQQSPEDPNLKRQIINFLPQMKKYAETSALGLYQLASIYPPNSAQYKQMILQAADKGCTNAMLAACRILVNNDLQQAMKYLQQIEQSQDTYMIAQAKKLIDTYPELTLSSQNKAVKTGIGTNAHGFFTASPKKENESPAVANQETHCP